MKPITYKVLLIEPSGNRNKLLLEILHNLDILVVSVNTIESAIQKAISSAPDLIICHEEFGDYTGFQVYNMLENEILKSGIPFIIMLSDYNKNSIMMGEELGIDGFIFPPLEAEKISNVIRTRIRKFRAGQSMSLRYFKRLYELIPMGIFIAENRRIIEANSYFYGLFDGADSKNLKHIDTLFDFEAVPGEKTKLLRFLNGLNSSISINSVTLKTNASENYKINLFYLENGIPDLKIVGIVIPQSTSVEVNACSVKSTNGNGEQHDNQPAAAKSKLFTNREQQILNLSEQGLPIKLIADQLAISERTVEKHRSNILRKTNTGNIIEALFFTKTHQFYELV